MSGRTGGGRGEERGLVLYSGEEMEHLRRQNEKLAKINAALMQRVERSMDHQANAFSMFQTAIGLEAQVRIRTEELKTALERLERVNEQLRSARDAAELADRFKTRFFTAVGHDLLQPLHAARLSLSAMTGGGSDEPQLRRLVGQVDHSLSTIEELLRTILDLSKLDAGVVRPSIETVRLGDVISSLVTDLEPIAGEKKLSLRVRPLDVLVLSDPLMLRRILQNLLANAVQYTEEGGILIAARRRGDMVRIDVWDTGPGIAIAEQTRIFEEFQRGAAAERSRGGGFGIGLSIISRMAQALDHAVDLCSMEGHGTRFSLTVPYAGVAASEEAKPKVSDTASLQSYGLAATTAMVVDNDPAVLEAMRALLQRWGCDVRYSPGLKGIEKVLEAEPQFRPSVVLVDYHLDEGVTGLTVIERVRERFGPDVPAVVITADRSDEVAGLVAGAECEILRKPVKPAELRALIMHLVS